MSSDKKTDFLNKVNELKKIKQLELNTLNEITYENMLHDTVIADVSFLKLSKIYPTGVEVIFKSTIKEIDHTFSAIVSAEELTKIMLLIAEKKFITIEIDMWGSLRSVITKGGA